MIMQLILFAALNWGPYTISLPTVDVMETVPSETLFLTITKETEVVKQIEVWQVEAETLDVDGDGIWELLITDFSGGAHCCFTYYLYSRKPDLRLLGAFEMGNGGLKFEDIDGNGILEGVGDYDGFAYFDFSYAASPFLPIVFTLKKGRYVEDTKSYPFLVKRTLLKRVTNLPEPGDEDSQKAYALALFTFAVLAEDEDAAWHLVRLRTPDMVPWLKETESDIKRILEDRKSRVKYTE